MVAGHVQLDLQRLLQQFGGNGTAVVSGASSSHGRAFFFFHPRIWGPEPSSGRPGRQLSVCRGHRKRFLQWPWFWVFKVKIWMAVVNNNLQKRRCVSQPKMLHVHAFSLSGNISQGCHTWWQKLRPMSPCFPRQAFCSSRLSLPLGRTGGYEIWCSEWNKHHRAIILCSLSLYIYI